jgi:hypothetical protein
MDESDAFRLQHSRKVSFFDCHRRFPPLSHEFKGDKESFKKGSRVRKGPPKQKLRAYMLKCLVNLRSHRMVALKVTTKSTTGLIKVVFGNSFI